MARQFRFAAWFTCVCCVVFASSRIANAQIVGFSRVVGGVAINADHMVMTLEPAELQALRAEVERMVQPAKDGLEHSTKLRKISLRQLEEVLKSCAAQKKPLPDSVKYLAGLQRIQYVLVYPEQQDIVIAGPAEAWKVDAHGEVVGANSEKPVMLLDDLLTALRTVKLSQQGGITVSIDPTQDGLAKLQQLANSLQTIGEPNSTVAALENAVGPHEITLTGVPDQSHFAAVLVAADYKLKRIGMNFENPGVHGLTSYLSIAKAGSRGLHSMLPRWWIVPQYDAVKGDKSGLAFEFAGAGAKVMTESSLVGENGKLKQTGTEDALAKKWADNMTSHFGDLSRKEPIFGQLLNCIDMSLLAALIDRHELTQKAGYDFAFLMDADKLPTMKTNVAKQVESKASVLKKGTNWLISVSGGVQIAPWLMLKNEQASEQPAEARVAAASATAKQWWWD
jgi:hypothetical protein